jgi:hypothetical protein
MSNIHRDFKSGADGENMVVGLLLSCGIKSEKNTVKKDRSYYDIFLYSKNGTRFSAEVKNDLYAQKSNNIAIEFYNPIADKKSGISITKASLWVHIIGQEIWITSITRLKEFLNETEPLRTIDNAGDGNASIVLYKREEILPKIFVQIDNADSKYIKEALRDLLKPQ